MVSLKSNSLAKPPPSAPTVYNERAWLPGVRNAKLRCLPSGLHVGESGQHSATRPPDPAPPPPPGPRAVGMVGPGPPDTCLTSSSRAPAPPPLLEESPSTE